MTAVEVNVLNKFESLGSLILLSQPCEAFSGLDYFNLLVSDKEIVETIPFRYTCGCLTAGDTV